MSSNVKKEWLEFPQNKDGKITLIKVVDQLFYEGHLKMVNKLEKEYIVFKAEYDMNEYCVTPLFYYIPPKESILINIKKFCKLETSPSTVKCVIRIEFVSTCKVLSDLGEAWASFRGEETKIKKTFEIIVDNGNIPLIYSELIKERKKIEKEYEHIESINFIESIEGLSLEIKKMKRKLKEVEKKIADINSSVSSFSCLEKEKKIDDEQEKIFDQYNMFLYKKKSSKCFRSILSRNFNNNNNLYNNNILNNTSKNTIENNTNNATINNTKNTTTNNNNNNTNNNSPHKNTTNISVIYYSSGVSFFSFLLYISVSLFLGKIIKIISRE